jgi:isopentenyldiphosphate isomerase
MSQMPDECDMTQNHIGVRRAAVRKLEHELGVKMDVEQFVVSANTCARTAHHCCRHMQPITRIQYGARSNETWGENEVDYILMCQVDSVDLNINKNEASARIASSTGERSQVSETRFVSADELKQLLVDDGKSTLKDG